MVGSHRKFGKGQYSNAWRWMLGAGCCMLDTRCQNRGTSIEIREIEKKFQVFPDPMQHLFFGQDDEGKGKPGVLQGPCRKTAESREGDSVQGASLFAGWVTNHGFHG